MVNPHKLFSDPVQLPGQARLHNHCDGVARVKQIELMQANRLQHARAGQAA